MPLSKQTTDQIRKEECAKQQAIGFNQWLQDNDWHDSLIRGFKVKPSGKESIENLYDLYLKTLNP